MGKYTDGMNLAVILTNRNLTILPNTYCFQEKHKNMYNTCLLGMLASFNLPYTQYILRLTRFGKLGHIGHWQAF